MKLLLFSGTHPRHLFINSEIIKQFDESFIVVMKREELIPKPPSNISSDDKSNFIKHFQNRFEKEKESYGELTHENVFKFEKKIVVDSKSLNSERVLKKVKEFNADLSIIFGVDLILDPLLSELPKNKLNIHLGLSPWYKGGATLFWPFYFLQPNYAGVTIHQITKNPDEGEIIHQFVPKLEFGDTIHDVGVKCVLKTKFEIIKVINHYKINKGFKGMTQTTSGRVWRGKDFKSSHLRVLYDLFNDDIVDKYLNNEIERSEPKLFSCIEKQVIK